MIKVIENFNKDDCKHFSWVFSRGCCGRGSIKSGACQIRLDNTGADIEIPNKVCSTSMRYCKYEKPEEV